jgi:hypothetical protein
MNLCFFCGPTENKITEEHVWPLWVSELLRGKYGSDHFIHVRSTGADTTGLWKSPDLKVTTKTVCDKCNNNWLSAFENDDIRPLATPLILGERVDIIKPYDQWKLAAWAYKMALLLEIAMPPEERSPEFYTADERLQFHETTLPDEHIRVFLANYRYGQHPTHAHQHLHTLTRREDGVKFQLRITTITAGCLGMQVIAVRGVDNGKLMYAKTEMEFEMLGKAKVAIAPIWPPTNEAVRWSSLEIMTTEDVEDWTEMWSKAENVFPVSRDPGSNESSQLPANRP